MALNAIKIKKPVPIPFGNGWAQAALVGNNTAIHTWNDDVPDPVPLELNYQTKNPNDFLDGVLDKQPKAEELPISKLYPYAALSIEKAKHTAYEQTQPKPTIHVVDERAIVGIEVEVENITDHVPLTHYWTVKGDGSLRNYGVEAVSIPLRGKQIEYAMLHLRNGLYSLNQPDFSLRTSCHVHLNVRDMTWNQIKTLVLLYAIFERHFFNIAGTKREESIFCVPIYKTHVLSGLNNVNTLVRNWHKYCALNLLPILGKDDIKRYGTVEFRHLYGTCDPATVIHWCNQIFCLRKAVHKYTYDDIYEKIKTLNTTSEYIALYTNIFDEYADLNKMMKYDFEYCISQAKKELFGKVYQKTLEPAANSPAYTMLSSFGVL